MIRSFYLNNIVYYLAGAASVAFVLSYFFPGMYRMAGLWLLLVVIAVVVDTLIVYSRNGIGAKRNTTDRFSIGDENKVTLQIGNLYAFATRVSVIDEIPVQFQDRDWIRKLVIQLNPPSSPPGWSKSRMLVNTWVACRRRTVCARF